MRRILLVVLIIVISLLFFGCLKEKKTEVTPKLLKPDEIKITWFGHSMFLIQSNEVSIVNDPFNSSIGYKFPEITCDIVTVSHNHYDHNNYDSLGGNLEILKEAGINTIKNITFEGISSYHDNARGAKNGPNVIFIWKIKEIKIAHLGDYGEDSLSPEQSFALEGTDVLFIPVGGMYTIDGKQAQKMIEQIKLRIAFPIHYKTSDCNIALNSLDEFTSGLNNVKDKNNTSVIISKKILPLDNEIWLLKYK